MTKTLDALLAPPSEADVAAALAQFAAAVRRRFGGGVRLIVFGSRARGDHRPDSDVDVAVLFRSRPPVDGSLVMALGRLAYDALADHGVEISPVPVFSDELDGSSSTMSPALAAAIRRDGVEVLPS